MSRAKRGEFACPICSKPTYVYDSWTEGDRIRRRRKCENGHRYNTSEQFMGPVQTHQSTQVEPPIPNAYDDLEAELLAEKGVVDEG